MIVIIMWIGLLFMYGSICNGERISEQSSDLLSIPPLSNATIWADFSHNNVSHLDDNSFHEAVNLEGLVVADNLIASVNLTAFDNLDSLLELDLNGNLLLSLPPLDAAADTLIILSLAYNDIELIEPGYFVAFSNLSNLNLAGNRLTALGNGVFNGLTSLTTLDLGYNDIREVRNGSWEGLDSLAMLYFSANSLMALDLLDLNESYCSPLETVGDTLTILNLRYNGIKRIRPGYFVGVSNLVQLHLAGNRLTALGNGVFSGLTSLFMLDLSANDIQELWDGSWLGLESVERLLLSENPLKTIFCNNTLNLLSVRIIYAEMCSLATFPCFAMDVIPTLENLYLRFNDITHINASSLENLTALQTLDLEYNPLLSLDFLLAGPPLRKLGINFIEGLSISEVAFQHVTSLERLNASGLFLDIFPNLWDAKSSIREFYGSTSAIRCVDTYHITNMTRLSILDLGYNNIIYFPDFGCARPLVDHNLTLLSFPYLYTLWLPYNDILEFPLLPDIGRDVSYYGPQINLNGNRMYSFPPERLALLAHVYTLHMNYNNATVFPDFSGLTRDNTLNALYLDHNHIADIPLEHIQSLQHLTRLHLSDNHIVTLPDMSMQRWALQYWYIDNNLLELITVGSMKQMPDLQELHADNNHIREMVFLTGAASNLSVAVLNNNRITQVPLSHVRRLVNLQFLYLQHNEIAYFPLSAVSTMAQLVYLDLQNNNLVSLENVTGLSFSPSATLDLRYNPFVCDKRLCWLRNFVEWNILRDTYLCARPPELINEVFDSILDDAMGCYDAYIRISGGALKSSYALNAHTSYKLAGSYQAFVDSVEGCTLLCHQSVTCTGFIFYPSVQVSESRDRFNCLVDNN